MQTSTPAPEQVYIKTEPCSRSPSPLDKSIKDKSIQAAVWATDIARSATQMPRSMSTIDSRIQKQQPCKHLPRRRKRRAEYDPDKVEPFLGCNPYYTVSKYRELVLSANYKASMLRQLDPTESELMIAVVDIYAFDYLKTLTLAQKQRLIEATDPEITAAAVKSRRPEGFKEFETYGLQLLQWNGYDMDLWLRYYIDLQKGYSPYNKYIMFGYVSGMYGTVFVNRLFKNKSQMIPQHATPASEQTWVEYFQLLCGNALIDNAQVSFQSCQILYLFALLHDAKHTEQFLQQQPDPRLSMTSKQLARFFQSTLTSLSMVQVDNLADRFMTHLANGCFFSTVYEST